VIDVVLVLDADGCLSSVEANGHAGKGVRGSDPVCAAVTVLLRTTLAVLEGAVPGISAASTGRGSLAFRAPAAAEETTALLRYAAVFLLEGIGSLQKEYPDAVHMRVERTKLILED
jgi:hypothetical protein